MKTTLIIKGGVIDSQYRGEIIIIMANHGHYPITIMPDDKVAQFILLKVPKVKIKEVKDLDETDRGEKGFGSSDEDNTGSAGE